MYICHNLWYNFYYRMANRTYQKLYKRASSGKVLVWWIQLNTETGAYRPWSGQIGGKVGPNAWTKVKGKNAGKANETTAVTQAISVIKSKYKKNLEGAYWLEEKDIDRVSYLQPMLANKFTDRIDKDDVSFPVGVQFKFDGTRCVTHGAIPDVCESPEGMWSRNGKQNHTCPHIFAEFKQLEEEFPGLVLDGELYSHGTALGDIAGLCSVNKKLKDITFAEFKETREKIVYRVYDGWDGCVTDQDSTYHLRHARLRELLRFCKYIQVVDTTICETFEEVMDFMEDAVNAKYEGAIIRDLAAPYCFGRGNQLLKLKKFEDEEFEIVEILPGEKGRWTGVAKKVLCKLPDGVTDKQGSNTFEANLRGSVEANTLLMENKDQWVGKSCTVKYQCLSKYGVPLIGYTGEPFGRDYE